MEWMMGFRLRMTAWLSVAASAALLTSASAQAATPVTVDVGGTAILVGAIGVDVGGELYDVNFADGTCAGLFGGCDDVSDFFFDNEADAVAASQALLDQVFINGPAGPFDAAPFLTVGCPGPAVFCDAVTPYGLTARNVLTGRASNSINEVFDGAAALPLVKTYDSVTGPLANGVTFAIWSPSIIPEPSTALLMGLGLAGLARQRRRQA